MIERKKGSLLLMIMLTALMINMGCNAKFVPTAYKTLVVMETAYDSMLTIAGDLYQKRIIDDKAKNRIIKAGKVYQESYELLVTALAAYQESKSMDDKEKAMFALITCLKSYDALVNVYMAFTDKEVPEGVLPDRAYLENVAQ